MHSALLNDDEYFLFHPIRHLSIIRPKNLFFYTANVYRDLQGLYGEIRVRGFQIYGDCMYA